MRKELVWIMCALVLVSSVVADFDVVVTGLELQHRDGTPATEPLKTGDRIVFDFKMSNYSEVIDVRFIALPSTYGAGCMYKTIEGDYRNYKCIFTVPPIRGDFDMTMTYKVKSYSRNSLGRLVRTITDGTPLFVGAYSFNPQLPNYEGCAQHRISVASCDKFALWNIIFLPW
jgi:hypothetical protein